jgi:type VI secretion system protein ImpJ
MKTLQRILWAEGILLGQQHFQQWDHYHHARQNFLHHAVAPLHRGIKKLVIDEQALQYGQLIIKQCQAIFSHGLVIDYDARVSPPLNLTLDTSQKALIEIYLAVPLNDFAQGISGYQDAMNAAWLANYQLITDDFDAERSREILMGHPRLSLLSGEEERSLYATIKILEVMQCSVGHFQCIENFVPPVLNIHSAVYLQNLLRTQIELLSAKSRLLRDRRRQFHAAMSEFNHSDLADFLLLQLFNSTLPSLQFLLQHPQHHPLSLYQTLIGFLGNLATFSEQQEKVGADYQHDDLRQTFSALDAWLKTLLESVIPSRMAVLKLKRETDSLYAIDSIDSVMFTKHSFFLAVMFEAASMQWLTQFVHEVKVGARSMIESLVASALPGVKLIHTQRPPNKLPVKAGYEYFYLEPHGVFWEQIKQERTFALFTSTIFTNATIELVTVQE